MCHAIFVAPLDPYEPKNFRGKNVTIPGLVNDRYWLVGKG